MKQPPENFRPGPFDYHEEVEVRIEDLNNLGSGVGRLNGWVVLVPFTIPGERVRGRIFRNHASYSEADLVEILEASPDRTAPPCPLFTRCGGCQYQHLRYEAQTAWKRRQLEEVLRRIGNITHPADEVHPSPREYGYRSKLTPHYAALRPSGSNPVGFLAFGQRQRIIDVPQCPIATPAINEALPALRREILEPGSRKRPRRGGTLLLRDVAEGVVTDPRAVVTERVGRLVFQFPAGEFFQNNPLILPAFAEAVVEAASGPGITHLIDAYCGSGLFSLVGAARFEKVLGIEVSDASVRWAQGNAALNRIGNAEFFVGDAGSIFARVHEPGERCAVILDPPRRGSDEVFLGQLAELKPARVVYVSCEPSTQARDLRWFLDAAGYRIERIQPFDLFPQTRHLETVVSLVRETPAG